MEKPTLKCRHCGKAGTIKYYYLSLKNKIQKWCASKNMCERMMAHWEEKDHWYYATGPWYPLREVWDGTRFAELSYFFDPEARFLLPSKCTFCRAIISTTKLKGNGLDVEGNVDIVKYQCQECGTVQNCHKQYVNGDPRNIVLMGHWDGWLPFQGSKNHGCGRYMNVNYKTYKSIVRNSQFRTL